MSLLSGTFPRGRRSQSHVSTHSVTLDILSSPKSDASSLHKILDRDMKVTKNERREALEHYGFECTCSHCSASAKESNASDERIQQIEMITEQLMDFGEQSEGKLDLADQLIEIYREVRTVSWFPLPWEVFFTTGDTHSSPIFRRSVFMTEWLSPLPLPQWPTIHSVTLIPRRRSQCKLVKPVC